MDTFRVIVAGSRMFNDYEKLCKELDYLLRTKAETHSITIVSGCAQGADKMGEQYANSKGYQVERYPAQWDTYGKKAGYLRNTQMSENADALVAFWDGKSKGTRHMINIMTKKKKQHRTVRY